MQDIPGTPAASHREPLMGTPVHSPPTKTSRVGEQTGMEAGFAPIPAFPRTASESAGSAVVDLDADGCLAAQQVEEQARLAQLASTYEGRAQLLAEAEGNREKYPDSPPENSFPCGACYSPTCKDCSLLPCVKAAAAAATKAQAQVFEGISNQSSTGLHASSSAYGPYGSKGASMAQSPPSGKCGDDSLSLADLLREIRGVNQNVDDKFESL